MKLVEILARELEEWPNADGHLVKSMSQDGDGEVSHYNDKIQTFHDDSWGASIQGYIPCSRFQVSKLATDYKTAIVTRADWEAERARIAKPASKANKDGWMRHRGGKCPVEAGVLVDVKVRGGNEFICVDADDEQWIHYNHSSDVMRYRIHKPSEQPVIEPVVVANVQAFNEQAELRYDPCAQGPLQWRDRLLELQNEMAYEKERYEANLLNMQQESADLIQRLESEGLQLLQAKACGSVQPVEDMSNPETWASGDLLKIVYADSTDSYAAGDVVSMKKISLSNSRYGFVFVEDENGKGWSMIIDQVKFHSRPQS
jgi:hypothetical protein